MKKAMISFLLFSLILILSSCTSRNLENPFFENTQKDSVLVASQLLHEYLSNVDDIIEEYYPRSGNEPDSEAIYNDSTFINAQLSSKDIIYRHEFYNYHLSENRYFMRYSMLYHITSTAFLNVLNSSLSNCNQTIEGEQCEITNSIVGGLTDMVGLQFFVEDRNLYIDFYSTFYSSNTLYHYVFLFYQDEQFNDVMELSIHISGVGEYLFDKMAYVKLTFGVEEQEYICNDCILTDPSNGSLEFMYTKFKEKPYQSYDFDTSNVEEFIRLSLYQGTIYGTIFDGLSGDMFTVKKTSEFAQASGYSKYIRNTMVVDYSDSHYRVNLNEVIGWDKLIKVDGHVNQYLLAYGDTILSDFYTVSITDYTGDYAYFDQLNSLSDDIISLSIFGLDTLYSNSYFESMLDQGSIIFNNRLEEYDLDGEYSTIYDSFIEKINTFR